MHRVIASAVSTRRCWRRERPCGCRRTTPTPARPTGCPTAGGLVDAPQQVDLGRLRHAARVDLDVVDLVPLGGARATVDAAPLPRRAAAAAASAAAFSLLGEVAGVGIAGRLAGQDPNPGAPVAAAVDLLGPAVVEAGRGRALVFGVDLGEVAPGSHRRRQDSLKDVVVDHPSRERSSEHRAHWRADSRRRGGDRGALARFRRCGRLRHEPLDVDDGANDLADGDEAALVGRRHGERETTSVDLGQDRLGDHLGADRRRLQVVEADVDADRRRRGGESPVRARQLASSHRAMSRGVPRTWTVPRPEGDRRVRLGDDELRLASQSGRDTPRHPEAKVSSPRRAFPRGGGGAGAETAGGAEQPRRPPIVTDLRDVCALSI